MRFSSGIDSCNSVQYLFYRHTISITVEMEIYESIIFPKFFAGVNLGIYTLNET
jgi:hypothetical protein